MYVFVLFVFICVHLCICVCKQLFSYSVNYYACIYLFMYVCSLMHLCMCTCIYVYTCFFYYLFPHSLYYNNLLRSIRKVLSGSSTVMLRHILSVPVLRSVSRVRGSLFDSSGEDGGHSGRLWGAAWCRKTAKNHTNDSVIVAFFDS